MFKKRSRPASVRDKRAEPRAEVEAESGPGGANGVEAESTESDSIEHMLLVRRLRKAQHSAGIDLDKLNRGEERKRKTEVEYALDQFGLQRRDAEEGAAVQSQPGPSNDETKNASGAGGAPTGSDEASLAAAKVRNLNFTGQTNTVDVDKHMMNYIESEMAKRKGTGPAPEASASTSHADSQAELYGLAERYKMEGRSAGTEDDDGNVTNSISMLGAIPEVDLGMDNRLRNIEETERAKRELAARRKVEEEQRRRGEVEEPGPRSYRTTREPDIQREMANARREAAGLPVHAPRERQHRPEMATDDQVYERFKKRMKR